MRGKAFRKALRQRDHTNESFAKLIKRSTRTITRWATDDTPVPREVEMILQSIKPNDAKRRRSEVHGNVG